MPAARAKLLMANVASKINKLLFDMGVLQMKFKLQYYTLSYFNSALSDKTIIFIMRTDPKPSYRIGF
jgi:hypothetical protein